MARECGSCTKCCDGWLSADIYGYQMKPHSPCKYLTDKCSIYRDRPSVCEEFICGWLRDDGTLFPDWMQPNVINNILVYNRIGNITWYKLVEAGEDINVLLLSFLIQESGRKQFNLEYYVSETQFLIGTDEFKSFVKSTAG
jgi:hypothetical protein